MRRESYPFVPQSVESEEKKEKPLRGQLIGRDKVLSYILAGQGVITIRSPKTGQRYTIQFKPAPPKRNREGGASSAIFVSILTGTDNTNPFHYTWLGTILHQRFYRHSPKSSINKDAPSAFIVDWFLNRVLPPSGVLPGKLEVWQEGVCAKCGDLLTVPESVERGFGPKCWKNMQKEMGS